MAIDSYKYLKHLQIMSTKASHKYFVCVYVHVAILSMSALLHHQKVLNGCVVGF